MFYFLLPYFWCDIVCRIVFVYGIYVVLRSTLTVSLLRVCTTDNAGGFYLCSCVYHLVYVFITAVCMNVCMCTTQCTTGAESENRRATDNLQARRCRHQPDLQDRFRGGGAAPSCLGGRGRPHLPVGPQRATSAPHHEGPRGRHL